MAKNATRDLTVGSPMKLILSFMLPLLFGMLFQQFYSMVDTVVVGKFLGVDAPSTATGKFVKNDKEPRTPLRFSTNVYCTRYCRRCLFPVCTVRIRPLTIQKT